MSWVSSDGDHRGFEAKEYGRGKHARHQKFEVVPTVWHANCAAKEQSKHQHDHDREDPPHDHRSGSESPVYEISASNGPGISHGPTEPCDGRTGLGDAFRWMKR